MSVLTKEEVLELVPQQVPFRFIDEILELTEEGIVATYTFKNEEWFYGGHFPGKPVTPGVITLEAMAQTGVVAYGIYLASKEMSKKEIQEHISVFTEAEIEFTGMVKPGEKITIRAKKKYFRSLKLKTEAEVTREDGAVVCRGTIAGIGMKLP